MEKTFDRVVADPLRFKQRLHIGEDAYAFLRARKALYSLWDTAGAGWTGVSVANSATVASAFFAPAAPAGVLGWLGLTAPAVAVTPVGWLIAAGVAAGGGYYGVTRWLASGPDRFVDTIPKFINTPLDLLGAGLFDLIAPLAMQVARADGVVGDVERETIVDHFVREWGLDDAYVAAGLRVIEADTDPATRVTALVKALAQLQRTSPDCNPGAMQAELLQFLRDIVEADGVVTPKEARSLRAIEAVFKDERALISRDTRKRARATIRDAADTVARVAASTKAIVVGVSEATTSLAGAIPETGKSWTTLAARRSRGSLRSNRSTEEK